MVQVFIYHLLCVNWNIKHAEYRGNLLSSLLPFNETLLLSPCSLRTIRRLYERLQLPQETTEGPRGGLEQIQLH